MPTAIINGKTVVVPKGHEVVEIDGEKKIVTVGEAKALKKALKAVVAAAGGGGGGAEAADSQMRVKRDLRTNAEKAHDVNLAAIEAEFVKNPCASLWRYYRSNITFYRVEEVDGPVATVSRHTTQYMKKDKLEAFMAAHPDAEVMEPEYVRIRKILPQPKFSTRNCAHDEVEVRYTSTTEVGITAGLLKEDGRRAALRELKVGAIVAVHYEIHDVMKTVWVSSAPGSGHHKDMWVPESVPRIFAVIPEEKYEAYEVAHDLKLE
jgi:hypothetical protein